MSNNNRLFRSIGAIFAGFLAVVISHTGTDAVMHATGVFPPWGQPMSDATYQRALDAGARSKCPP